MEEITWQTFEQIRSAEFVVSIHEGPIQSLVTCYPHVGLMFKWFKLFQISPR